MKAVQVCAHAVLISCLNLLHGRLSRPAMSVMGRRMLHGTFSTVPRTPHGFRSVPLCKKRCAVHLLPGSTRTRLASPQQGQAQRLPGRSAGASAGGARHSGCSMRWQPAQLSRAPAVQPCCQHIKWHSAVQHAWQPCCQRSTWDRWPLVPGACMPSMCRQPARLRRAPAAKRPQISCA